MPTPAHGLPAVSTLRPRLRKGSGAHALESPGAIHRNVVCAIVDGIVIVCVTDVSKAKVPSSILSLFPSLNVTCAIGISKVDQSTPYKTPLKLGAIYWNVDNVVVLPK